MSVVIEAANDFTPSSRRPWHTRARSMPRASSSATAACAPSRSVASVAATVPWSMKAVSVAGGTVSTVSAPMSASRYIVSA